MIYKCENCQNRYDCCENKEQYERMSKTIEDIARGLDRMPDYHSYYSLTIKCDYWIRDNDAIERACVCPSEKGGAEL